MPRIFPLPSLGYTHLFARPVLTATGFRMAGVVAFHAKRRLGLLRRANSEVLREDQMRAGCRRAAETAVMHDRRHYCELLTANYSLVQEVVRGVAKRYWLRADEAEELGSVVRLKMVENDYAILRQWQGRSALQTYLTTVISRIHLDIRTASWGRWRPSARARRLGLTAVKLETLIRRDGLSLDEATEVLRTNDGAPTTREELEVLYALLPNRPQRRMVEAGELENLPSTETERANDPRIDRLRVALRRLPPGDLDILELIYVSDLRVVDVARDRGLEPKVLYRHLSRLRRHLRAHVATSTASRRNTGETNPVGSSSCAGSEHFGVSPVTSGLSRAAGCN